MTSARLAAAALALGLGFALAATPCFAAGSGGSSSTDTTSTTPGPSSGDYQTAKKKIDAGDYKGAIPILENLVKSSPRNADALSELGFCYRHLGQKEKALAYYNKALSVEPKHLGANEYMGELYLQMGMLPKAKERLAVLSDACKNCEEYGDLKKQIDAFKSKQQSS